MSDRIIDQIANADHCVTDITFDFLTIVLKPFFQTFQCVGVRSLRSFASGAVAGNVFLVAELFIGVVDVLEFVADDFTKGLFEFAGDADADFIFVISFDDFGMGITLSEDNAFFPNEITIDKQMRRALKLLTNQSAESMVNQLVFLSTYSSEAQRMDDRGEPSFPLGFYLDN